MNNAIDLYNVNGLFVGFIQKEKAGLILGIVIRILSEVNLLLLGGEVVQLDVLGQTGRCS